MTMTETISHAVERAARGAVNSGRSVAEAANATFDSLNLADDEILYLARRGFTTLVHHEHSSMRVTVDDVNRSRLDEVALAIHKVPGFCSFTTHHRSKKKAIACATSIAEMPAQERDAAIEKHRSRTAQWDEQDHERQSTFVSTMSSLWTEYGEAERRDERNKVLASIPWVGADGTSKTLATLNAEDLSDSAAKADVQRKSWGLRKEWFEDAGNRLAASGVETVGDLPIDDLDEVSSAAETVWRRAA